MTLADPIKKCVGLTNPRCENQTLLEALLALPRYSTERNWSSNDPDATIEICNCCGFPGVGDHDGQEDCPVARVEALLREGAKT